MIMTVVMVVLISLVMVGVSDGDDGGAPSVIYSETFDAERKKIKWNGLLEVH